MRAGPRGRPHPLPPSSASGACDGLLLCWPPTAHNLEENLAGFNARSVVKPWIYAKAPEVVSLKWQLLKRRDV